MSVDSAATTDRLATAETTAVARAWSWLEDKLNRVGDYLNPILVKETRQALKSRQFVLTFVLVLVACWLITIVGVLYLGPGIYYSASGGLFLMAYNYALVFPLSVVVPFGAFRSLLTEREDNTYDLLTVTSLSSRHIINGKLSSAIVQITVYFSAMAPCFAFTYLLRGVDVLSIAIFLFCNFFGSLGLCLCGLTLAAASKNRMGQTFTSVGFVAALIGVCIFAWVGVTYFVEEGYQYQQEEGFWVLALLIITIYVCAFVSLYFAATALTTFSSANRSTPLRWSMILHQLCFVGWVAFPWILYGHQEEEIAVMAAWCAAAYWYLMGTFLVSEPPVLSNRVRRALPQSLLGRTTLSWFNPGSGTGYGFAVINLTVLTVVAGILLEFHRWTYGTNPRYFYYMAAIAVAWGYAVAYLGLGRLLLSGLRRFGGVSVLAGFLINVILVIAGTGIPMIIYSSFRAFRYAGYTLLQITNPFWSLVHVVDRGGSETMLLLLIVPAVAVCLLLANLPAMAREICQTRLPLPARVVADEVELHPVVEVPSSPWDLPDEDQPSL